MPLSEQVHKNLEERNSLVTQCAGNHKELGIAGWLGTRYHLEKDEGTWEAGSGSVSWHIKGFGLHPESLMSQTGLEAGSWQLPLGFTIEGWPLRRGRWTEVRGPGG